MSDRTILVIGATGRQGGASARHLLEHGFRVRALTRDARSAKARALADRGAEVVQGDLDDAPALERAMDGVYGVHSVQAYMPKEPEREVRQGTTVVDVARAAGVRHFVYSSAAGADRGIGIPETESKWTIERHVRASGLPATILRPAYFMDNLEFMKPWILQGTWSMSLPADRKLQMIAADDIGRFSALAFARPEEFTGRAIELAGDELSMLEIAERLGRVLRRTVMFVELPIEQTRAFDSNLAALCAWLATNDFGATIAELRMVAPALMTLDDWLCAAGWTGTTGLAASATRTSA